MWNVLVFESVKTSDDVEVTDVIISDILPTNFIYKQFTFLFTKRNPTVNFERY